MPKHLVLPLLILLSACGPAGNRRAEKRDAKPKITVSIEPLRHFTEAIADDRFEVISLVPDGVSPETYDPTPQQMVSLTDSRAYFLVGQLGFERTWRRSLSDNAPHLLFFDLSRGVVPIPDEHQHAEPEQPQEPGMPPAPPFSIEPHVWTAPSSALTLAENIAAALIMVDPDNEPLYLEGYERTCRDIERTDSLVRAALDTTSVDRAFVIYHPALSYFARDYGLHQIAIEADGKEPSPAQLAELIETAKAEHVRVVFVQPEFDTRNAELVADQIGAEVVRINPLSYQWEEQLVGIARALAHRQ